MCVCVCVCVYERERRIDDFSKYTALCDILALFECVCVGERLGKREREREREREKERERQREREKERERERERETEIVPTNWSGGTV